MFNEDINFWTRAVSVKLLILDDIGREYSKEFGKSLIEKIIRTRNDKKLSTIITTNLDPKDFKAVYGDGTYEAMKECFVPVKFEGINYRDNILKDNIKKYN